jgi:hypothetical protein
MTEKLGHPVNFGDTIQLLHVKSNKYVTVIPGELAKDQRENIRIRMSSVGSALSWFIVSPRYKIDREGEVLHISICCLYYYNYYDYEYDYN